jgi:hypothetical protein
MSADAIIMMAIGCTCLWGGFILSCVIALRYSSKMKNKQAGGESDKLNGTKP